MKQALRALSIATIIFWIIILAFVITLVYSAMNIRIELGDHQITTTNETLTISIPLHINNTGFYDITDLNITTSLTNNDGTFLTYASTTVESIPYGNGKTVFHNITVNINDMIAKSQSLLFNDTVLNFTQTFKLTLAHAVPIHLSTNQTLEWGAPLYNFTMTKPVFEPSVTPNQKATVTVSFENHSSYFNINGTMRIQIFNDQNQLVGEATRTLNVESHSRFEDKIELNIDATKVTEKGEVWFYFETSTFDFGPLVIPYD
jgi:hypothetical protein